LVELSRARACFRQLSRTFKGCVCLRLGRTRFLIVCRRNATSGFLFPNQGGLPHNKARRALQATLAQVATRSHGLGRRVRFCGRGTTNRLIWVVLTVAGVCSGIRTAARGIDDRLYLAECEAGSAAIADEESPEYRDGNQQCCWTPRSKSGSCGGGAVSW
jgi:hypothetical protein